MERRLPGGAACPRYAARPMAADPQASAEPDGPLPCSPCRGTGRLISRAGGSDHEVTCPWCEGGGTLIPGHDAQAARRGEPSGSEAAAPEVE